MDEICIILYQSSLWNKFQKSLLYLDRYLSNYHLYLICYLKEKCAIYSFFKSMRFALFIQFYQFGRIYFIAPHDCLYIKDKSFVSDVSLVCHNLALVLRNSSKILMKKFATLNPSMELPLISISKRSLCSIIKNNVRTYGETSNAVYR